MGDIVSFVQESNRIEGIKQTSTLEVAATQAFLNNKAPTIKDAEELVGILQPGAVLRRRANQNVRVGDHVAPQGGPKTVSDAQRRRAIAKAEQEGGFKEGARIHKVTNAEHLVEVTLYRGPKWWVSDIDPDTRQLTNRRPLTKEFWDELEPLKL